MAQQGSGGRSCKNDETMGAVVRVSDAISKVPLDLCFQNEAGSGPACVISFESMVNARQLPLEFVIAFLTAVESLMLEIPLHTPAQRNFMNSYFVHRNGLRRVLTAWMFRAVWIDMAWHKILRKVWGVAATAVEVAEVDDEQWPLSQMEERPLRVIWAQCDNNETVFVDTWCDFFVYICLTLEELVSAERMVINETDTYDTEDNDTTETYNVELDGIAMAMGMNPYKEEYTALFASSLYAWLERPFP